MRDFEEIEERFFDQRKLFINDKIEENLITSVFASMEELKQDNSKKPIHLYINSLGGNAYDGLFLASYIKTSKTPIYTYCLGTAQSAGCIILLGGHKRFAYTYSTLMMHLPQTELEFSKASNLLSNAKSIEMLDNFIYDFILKQSNLKNLAKVKSLLRDDFFFSPEKAIELGFIHEIL